MVEVTIETSSLALMEIARAAEKRAQENADANRNDLAKELRIAAQELETAALEVEERSSSSQATSQVEGSGAGQ